MSIAIIAIVHSLHPTQVVIVRTVTLSGVGGNGNSRGEENGVHATSIHSDAVAREILSPVYTLKLKVTVNRLLINYMS